MNPHSNFQTNSQFIKMLIGAAISRTYVVAENSPCACTNLFPASKQTYPGSPHIKTRKYNPANSADRGSGMILRRMNSALYQKMAIGIVRHHRKKTMRCS